MTTEGHPRGANATPGSEPNPRNLPDFPKPPLVEVSMGVQFAPLERLGGLEVGLLWDEEGFPRS